MLSEDAIRDLVDVLSEVAEHPQGPPYRVREIIEAHVRRHLQAANQPQPPPSRDTSAGHAPPDDRLTRAVGLLRRVELEEGYVLNGDVEDFLTEIGDAT